MKQDRLVGFAKIGGNVEWMIKTERGNLQHVVTGFQSLFGKAHEIRVGDRLVHFIVSKEFVKLNEFDLNHFFQDFLPKKNAKNTIVFKNGNGHYSTVVVYEGPKQILKFLGKQILDDFFNFRSEQLLSNPAIPELIGIDIDTSAIPSISIHVINTSQGVFNGNGGFNDKSLSESIIKMFNNMLRTATWINKGVF